MASYFATDIQVFDDGELDIADDIQVAGVRQSQRQLLINLLQTTRGSYRFQPLFGWGGELYIGRPNSPLTHRMMWDDLKVGIGAVDEFDPQDLNFEITILDKNTNSAAIIVHHSGVFIEPDGSTPTDTLALGWVYSYETGKIEPLE